MEILLSTQMLVGESIMTPNSQRIPSNQTHCVVALTAAPYLVSADESEMVFCFLLEKKMGPSSILKAKPEVYFLSMGSPAQSESENPTS